MCSRGRSIARWLARFNRCSSALCFPHLLVRTPLDTANSQGLSAFTPEIARVGSMSDEKWERSTAYSAEEEEGGEYAKTSDGHEVTTADASGALDGFGLKLIVCEWCERSHTALQHCLARFNNNGGAHTPRLQVVKGKRHAMLRGCKALLLPGQRENLAGGSGPVEHGAVEDLPLSPSNLALR